VILRAGIESRFEVLLEARLLTRALEPTLEVLGVSFGSVGGGHLAVRTLKGAFGTGDGARRS